MPKNGRNSNHNGRRFRRARRRGRLIPAQATRISNRARYWKRPHKWIVSKSITRKHPLEWYYANYE